jgi:hypothetical protein
MTFLDVRSTLAGAVLLAGFQMPSTPPMRMGLWEQTTTVNMKMTGANIPPGMPTNQTIKMQSCFTEDAWQKMLANQTKSCTFSNQSASANHFSTDMDCGSGKSFKMTGHIEATFSSMESGKGTSHVSSVGPNMSIVSDGTTDMRFVSSSCGALEPGKSKIVGR